MGDEYQSLPDHLKDFAAAVPQFLQKCKADSTVRKYSYAFLRWKTWILENNFGETCVFPAKPYHFCVYLSYLANTNGTVGAASDAFYGIKWAHEIVGLVSPTEQSKIIKMVFDGIKRTLSKPIRKKDPITASILKTVYDAVFDHGNLYHQRLLSMTILAYAGFFRSAEILHLRRSDIHICTTHAQIFIEQSKTDIYRDGAWVILSKLDSSLCPVRNLELYFNLASIPPNSDEFIFRNVSKKKGHYVLRKDDKPLTYTRFREHFIEVFSPYVADISKFGLHSFRAGGASAAANNGIPDRLFKRHGRWRSESAKDGYVEDKFSERLSVSQNLDL